MHRLIFALSLMLALAGCGGGDDDTSTCPPTMGALADGHKPACADVPPPLDCKARPELCA